jgi:hypothetical protein
MPKLELKPWKLGEPQVVYLSQWEKTRIIVKFRKDKYVGNINRLIYFEISGYEDNMGKPVWRELFWNEETDENQDMSFLDEFVNLLGIPEIIKEEEDENL